MVKTYKTIIVGAGPAGLNAARSLQQDYLIIDEGKRDFAGRTMVGKHLLELCQFAKIWQAAKVYLW